MTKAEKIKATLQQIRQKRENQQPFVLKLKIQNLTKSKKAKLERAFLEAKWLYNWLVADTERLKMALHKVDRVEIEVGDHFEERQLTVLSAQIKQGIGAKVQNNLKSLRELKNNGYKTGRLKFKSYVNSIPLKQKEVTYKLFPEKNKIRIQKLGVFRVLGVRQIFPGLEMAHAELIKKPGGYYVHITCYVDRSEYFSSKKMLNKSVGGDFGIQNKLTLSTGMKIDFEVHETERLKKLQKKLSRQQKGSSNYRKTQQAIRREYQKIVNRRKDAQNKIIAFLRIYASVCYQDDSVKSWAYWFGRQVQSSGVGGLKTRLSSSLETPVPVDRTEPTTSECFWCGGRVNVSLSDRVIQCECGWKCDRDLNSALVMLRKGHHLSPDQVVGLGWSELTPLERETSARILGSNSYIRVSMLSMKEEALTPFRCREEVTTHAHLK